MSPSDAPKHSAWKHHDTRYATALGTPYAEYMCDQLPNTPTLSDIPKGRYDYISPHQSQRQHSSRIASSHQYRYHTFPDPANADNATTGGRDEGGESGGREQCYYETLDLSDYLDSLDSGEGCLAKQEQQLEVLVLGSGFANREQPTKTWWWAVHRVIVAVSWVLLVVIWVSVVVTAGWAIKGGRGKKFVARGLHESQNGLEVGEWVPCTTTRPRFCRLIVGADG
ncbi:hypothetical protein P885DRAFT_81051 [Corynascus similis CBS 632.67]